MRWLLVLIALAPTLAYSADTIRIGYVTGLTSPESLKGANRAFNTAQLLVDEANAKGGIHGKKIELIPFDDQGDPAVAYSLRDKVQQANLTAMVGFQTSTQAAALLPQLERLKVPTILSCAASPFLLKGRKYVAQTIVSIDVYGKALAKKVLETGKKKLLLAADINDLSAVLETENFVKEYTSLGGTIVRLFDIDADNKDFYELADEILKEESKADALLMTGHTVSVFYLWSILKKNLKLDILAGGGIQTHNFAAIPSKMEREFNIKVFLHLWDPLNKRKEPSAKAFLEKYKERFHDEIGNSDADAILTHDAIVLLLKALGSSPSLSPDDVMARIKSTEIDGLTGKLSYNQQGASSLRIYFYRIKNGVLYHAN
jgi:branched-chain amino acid transport system substrate-binding protein